MTESAMIREAAAATQTATVCGLLPETWRQIHEEHIIEATHLVKLFEASKSQQRDSLMQLFSETKLAGAPVWRGYDHAWLKQCTLQNCLSGIEFTIVYAFCLHCGCVLVDVRHRCAGIAGFAP